MHNLVTITPALCVTRYTGTLPALLALGLFPPEVFPELPKRTRMAWLDHAGSVVPAENVPRDYAFHARHPVLCCVERLKGGRYRVELQHDREQRQSAMQVRMKP